jgi:methionyl-tRNA synthetase
MTERFYVTTPIYYINDLPHLGTAYSTIAADVLCRYHRLRGHDAFFLTGTDEHGLKIQREAEARGTSPQALADEIAAVFRATWPDLGCAPDDFIRTTEARHQARVVELWERIARAGDIYLGHYEGLYCVRCEAYYTEKELGQPGNLCPFHGAPVERMKEESYFFRLAKYGPKLLAFYERSPGFVQPESRMNEVRSFVSGGLEDLSLSRTTFSWGIGVPGDARHVMYVWFDALSNYWTALQTPAAHAKYWPATVHLVGKDILRFHAVYWPAFLMAAGFAESELPRKVLAHGFLTYGGAKMSKSLRNTIGPVALARALSPTVGVDTLRYAMMRAISFGHDGDFSVDDLLARYAGDLGNTLGNLLHRVLPFAAGPLAPAHPGPLEGELAAATETAARESAAAFDGCSPTRALEAVWAGLAAANAYVDRAAPWAARKKGDGERLATIVASLVAALDAFSVMIAPVMPAVATRMRAQLGAAPLAPAIGDDRWPLAPVSVAGRVLAPGEPIFPRIDPERAAEIRAAFAPPPTEDRGAAPNDAPAPAKQEAAPPAAPAKPPIAYEDFAKLDLRVGVVVAAERVAGKDRLLSLRVDLGEAEPRALVAGIAASYPPEILVGRRIVVLTNLAPRKFGKGLVSHGMLLAAEGDGGSRLLAVDGEAAPGSPIK